MLAAVPPTILSPVKEPPTLPSNYYYKILRLVFGAERLLSDHITYFSLLELLKIRKHRTLLLQISVLTCLSVLLLSLLHISNMYSHT